PAAASAGAPAAGGELASGPRRGRYGTGRARAPALLAGAAELCRLGRLPGARRGHRRRPLPDAGVAALAPVWPPRQCREACAGLARQGVAPTERARRRLGRLG